MLYSIVVDLLHPMFLFFAILLMYLKFKNKFLALIPAFFHFLYKSFLIFGILLYSWHPMFGTIALYSYSFTTIFLFIFAWQQFKSK
jgi:hypothetical protein